MARDFDRKQWLKDRQSGIGGSDIAAIMGKSSFGKTAADVYDEKVAQVIVDPEPSPDMQRGMALEDVAVEEYVKRTGRLVRRQPMRRHRDYPVLMANIDRQIVGDPRGPGTLEVKVPRMSTFFRIKSKGLSDDYILQNQQYSEVYDYSWGAFSIFNADTWQVVHFDIDRDQEIGQVILQQARSFWEDYVLKHIRPPEPEALDLNLPDVGGEIIVLDDPVFQDAMRDLWEARDLAKASEELKKASEQKVKDLIVAQLGGLGVVETPESERVYYTRQTGRVTFQRKLLEQGGPIDALRLSQELQQRGLTPMAVAEIIDATRLDLTEFEKRGADFETLRPYRLKRHIEEE
jgi:putative phage-type endonuclease